MPVLMFRPCRCWRAGTFRVDNADAFRIRDSDKSPCTGYAHKRVGIALVHIEPGNNRFDFNSAPTPR